MEPAPPLSDHVVVIADFDLCVRKKPKSQHIIYKWDKCDSEGIQNYVEEQLSKKSFADNKDIEDI